MQRIYLLILDHITISTPAAYNTLKIQISKSPLEVIMIKDKCG